MKRYLNLYTEYKKALKLGLTLNASEYTRKQVDALYIIDLKLDALRSKK